KENNVTLGYEAAIAGGIPIIKSLREGLVANRFSKAVGILNGTCNFILTSMWRERKAFDEVLQEAQRIGYAEADPSFDIDGIDTSHKIAIITSLAFGCPINADAVYVEGIRNISILDMEFADQFGFVIKLLGISTETEHGILQRVHPAMVAKDSTIGRVGGAYNAVIVEGNAVGRLTLEGAGAGAGATASSVVGDIVDAARGVIYKPFTTPVACLKKLNYADITTLKTSYYLRLLVEDKPGVLAAITAIFRDQGISVSGFLQNSSPLLGARAGNVKSQNGTQIVITTHETLELSMQNALKLINQLDFVIQPTQMIRIENI
ncbi:MAG: homoserine dehydrogenase, partial [Pseudomonadota bacterium]